MKMHSMQARRDVRTRKILENAAKRLQMISNVYDSNHSTEEQIPNANCTMEARTSLLSCDKPARHNQDITAAKEQIEIQSVNESIHFPTQPPSDLNFDSNADSRIATFRLYIIILLALMIRLLFTCSKQFEYLISYDLLFNLYLNNVLVPFILFEIIGYVFFKPTNTHGSVLNYLFIFNFSIGINKIEKLVKTLKLLIGIVQDCMVYLFVFICFDNFVVYVTGN